MKIIEQKYFDLFHVMRILRLLGGSSYLIFVNKIDLIVNYQYKITNQFL